MSRHCGGEEGMMALSGFFSGQRDPFRTKPRPGVKDGRTLAEIPASEAVPIGESDLAAEKAAFKEPPEKK